MTHPARTEMRSSGEEAGNVTADVPQPVAPAESSSEVSSAHERLQTLVGAATPTWPWFPPGPRLEWTKFGQFPNPFVAHIIAGRLETEGVPTIVETKSFFPGGALASVWVPKLLAHRAHWVFLWPPPSDGELAFLATGELPRDNEL